MCHTLFQPCGQVIRKSQSISLFFYLYRQKGSIITKEHLRPANRYPELRLRNGDHKIENISNHMAIRSGDYTVTPDPIYPVLNTLATTIRMTITSPMLT